MEPANIGLSTEARQPTNMDNGRLRPPAAVATSSLSQHQQYHTLSHGGDIIPSV